MSEFFFFFFLCLNFYSGSDGKESACDAMRETQDQSLGLADPLEKEMATHSSILTWRIPSTEEPGKLQAKESDMTERLTL